ncbi:MAG: toll/interleukin-1 receptor domain-containing protein [Planctomycetes bacterium]|nr:toll/interleukin-1 receptor domain-containing protein [Planctomycetota bacterium]
MHRSRMKVFISHSERDRELAGDIAERLGRAGLDVWRDTEIVSGQNFAQQVATALDSSDAMIVLLSPEWVGSRWGREEINFALGSARFEGRVLPVEVRPTPDMPWVLRHFRHLKLTRDLNRLSAQIVETLAHTSDD